MKFTNPLSSTSDTPNELIKTASDHVSSFYSELFL